MTTTLTCRSCGGEIPPSRRTCPACGAARPRTGSPQVWPSPGARRVALGVGIVMALLILAVLVWKVADSRRTPLEPSAPVLPIGGSGTRDHPGNGGAPG